MRETIHVANLDESAAQRRSHPFQDVVEVQRQMRSQSERDHTTRCQPSRTSTVSQIRLPRWVLSPLILRDTCGFASKRLPRPIQRVNPTVLVERHGACDAPPRVAVERRPSEAFGRLTVRIPACSASTVRRLACNFFLSLSAFIAWCACRRNRPANSGDIASDSRLISRRSGTGVARGSRREMPLRRCGNGTSKTAAIAAGRRAGVTSIQCGYGGGGQPSRPRRAL
jgi:hypothetical protein